MDGAKKSYYHHRKLIMGQLLKNISVQNSTKVLKALIVDDLKINRSLARIMLERNNFEIVEAENGQQALEHFNIEDLDVVLMDICMPVMDGIEAMTKIRELNKKENGIPIIAFTSGEHENSKSDLIRKGFSEYIKKPFKEEDLFDKISKFLPLNKSLETQKISVNPAV